MSSRDKKFIVVIAALVLMLIVLLVGILIYAGTGEEEPGGGKDIIISNNNSVPEEESSGSEIVPEEMLEEGIEIKTPCGTFYYPEEWEPYLETETDENTPFTVKFYAKIEGYEKQPIFDIIFGTGSGDFYGNVKGGDGKIHPVYTKVYDLDVPSGWSDEEKNIAENMQEDINRILGQMERAENSALPGYGGDDIAIETENVTLYYPSMWEEWLEVEKTEETVSFYVSIGNHEKEKIFDLIFSEKGDILLGELKTENGKNVIISVIIYDPAFDGSWTEDEKQTAYGMMEDMNYTVGKLSENENFTPGY